jgi:hypothetical protein
VHRRDRDSASDWFGVAIDLVHERRTAHELRVNADGVQRDVLLYADTSTDDTWDDCSSDLAEIALGTRAERRRNMPEQAISEWRLTAKGGFQVERDVTMNAIVLLRWRPAGAVTVLPSARSPSQYRSR